MTIPPDRPRVLVQFAEACHTALIWLAPRHVREGYGEEMRDAFRAMCEPAAARGWIAVFGLLGREALDFLRARRLNRALTPPRPTTQERPRLMNAFLAEFLRPRGWRQSVRSLAHRRAFAIVAILALAFSAGITTAVFGLVDTVLVAPLPYPDADRLVTLYEASPSERGKTSLVAPARLEDWQRLNTTFDAISSIYTENVTDTSGPTPERLDGRRVTPRYFVVYGAAPIAGRTFTPDEERFGGPTSAVISEGFWSRRYARSASAVGSRLVFGGVGYTIVGVMPRSFTSFSVDVWLPAQLTPSLMQIREARFLGGVGRMKRGVTIEHATSDLGRVQRDLGQAFPASDKDWSVQVQDLKVYRVNGRERPLWLVFGAVGLLWLVGVANLAGLMLVEMRRRAREFSVRAAIGASRVQIMGAVMREVLTLAVVGSCLGAALGAWLIAIAKTTITTLPRATEIGFNGRALAFAAISGMAAAALSSLWPALRASRSAIVTEAARTSRGASRRRHGLQQVLVAAQVALSVLLVGSALLLTRTYLELSGAHPGFRTDHVITFHVGARWDEDRPRVGQMQERLIDALERLPGVEAAGFTNFLPMMGATLRSHVFISGLAGPDRDGTMTTGMRNVTAGYLKALDIPIESGTPCPRVRMDFNAPQQALVNRRFVQTFAGGEQLIGRELRFGERDRSVFTIIGVAGDVVEDAPGADPAPYVYICQSAGSWPDPEYVVRASDGATVAASLRTLVKGLDPGRAVFGVRPLDEAMHRALDEPRLGATMLGLFAASALTLASLGVYSLFMLLVAEGTREIGVRLALGARPATVVRLVVADAGRLAIAGVVIGLMLSAVAQRLLRSVLSGLGPLDVITLTATAGVLLAATAAAVAIPARRASRVDPIVAMRSE